ncbi:MAG: hypothetical protein QXS20_04620 [Candidatus Thorarchaeota archaeon]
MPRPGMLTRSRVNRLVRTPGRRLVMHRRKVYRCRGTCGLTGRPMSLKKGARQDNSTRSSRSAKRPNRPYGGCATSGAVRRVIIQRVREL